MKCRLAGLHAKQECNIQEQIARVEHGRARRGTAQEDAGMEPFVVDGDKVEIYRDPDNKDVSGWRGPAIFKSGPSHGKIIVKWGARVLEVNADLLGHYARTDFAFVASCH